MVEAKSLLNFRHLTQLIDENGKNYSFQIVFMAIIYTILLYCNIYRIRMIILIYTPTNFYSKHRNEVALFHREFILSTLFRSFSILLWSPLKTHFFRENSFFCAPSNFWHQFWQVASMVSFLWAKIAECRSSTRGFDLADDLSTWQYFGLNSFRELALLSTDWPDLLILSAISA